MKSLYVTSVERFSGKTATCLALGMRFQADGYQVGYLKPFSMQPYRISDPKTGTVHVADEDAAFVKVILDLSAEPWELSPVVLTPEFLEEILKTGQAPALMDKVKQAYSQAIIGKDILLLEGGGSLREGYVVGLPTPEVARQLASKALAIIRYRGEVLTLDDVLAAQLRLGEALCGVILNRLPEESKHFITEIALPFLEKRGIPVFGVLPDTKSLSALTVGELIKVLDAEVLTRLTRPQALIESMTVGAMTAETALSRFRKYPNKAVITGGDRTDIQLAALETSTTCLVLTGNLRPSPLVVKQAEEFGVAVLLVRTNTMETIEAIERVFGKTRLGEKAKLKHFQALMDEHCDFERLYTAIGIK
jgi:BioD-like phosphotransacetylase family protein